MVVQQEAIDDLILCLEEAKASAEEMGLVFVAYVIDMALLEAKEEASK